MSNRRKMVRPVVDAQEVPSCLRGSPSRVVDYLPPKYGRLDLIHAWYLRNAALFYWYQLTGAEVPREVSIRHVEPDLRRAGERLAKDLIAGKAI